MLCIKSRLFSTQFSQVPIPVSSQGTTTTPIPAACATNDFTTASWLNPASLFSVLLIVAISYTCFKLTLPTVPSVALPSFGWLTCCLPLAPSLLFRGPGGFPAPRSLPLISLTPAARRRRMADGGVRVSKWKLRSGRTVTRAGIGMPGV